MKKWHIFSLIGMILFLVLNCLLTKSGKVEIDSEIDRTEGPTDSYTPLSTIKSASGFDSGFFLIPRCRHLQGMPLAGLSKVEWSRVTGLVWSKLQKQSGEYDWEFMDSFVKKAQAEGYNLVFVLKTGNHRVISDAACYKSIDKTDPEAILHSCPIKPEYEGKWKSLVYNIIERYDGDGNQDMPGLNDSFVLDIQIENEAGNPYYWFFNEEKDGRKAAIEFLKILRLAYEAKEEANPCTRIIIPGIIHGHRLARCDSSKLNPAVCSADFERRNRDFTKEVLKHPEYFDAVDIHEFIYFKFDPYYIKDGLSWLKAEMKKNGYFKPIYCLEWTGAFMLSVKSDGFYKEFSAHFPYTQEFDNIKSAFQMYYDLANPKNRKYREWFESEQAGELVKMLTSMLLNGVERMIHVQFIDYIEGVTDWDNVWWNWQGVVRFEGTRENPVLIKKPSYYTYELLMNKIDGFISAQEFDFGYNTFVYRFTYKDRKPVFVVWTEDSDRTINLSKYVSSENIKITHIVTKLDNNNPIYPSSQTAPASSVPVAETPVFVEEN